MASFFNKGEVKIRPGMYQRYENYGTPPTIGADDGKCACVIRSNWGPIGQAVLLDSMDNIQEHFGTGGAQSTLSVPQEQFNGGAVSVRAVRVGTGGTQGVVTLRDEEGTEVLRLLLQYVGSRPLSVTLRPTVEAELSNSSIYEKIETSSTYETLEEEDYENLEIGILADDAVYELLILEGTTQLECLSFQNPPGEKEAWALASQSSDYVTFLPLAVTESRLATVEQVDFTGGTDPDITVEAYDSAFTVLEPHRFNTIALDTEEIAVAMLLQAFVARIYLEGKNTIAVVGDPTTTDFDTRLARASAFNDYKVVYVGSGFIDSTGTVYEGYLAAARISGLIAGTASNKSITHLALSGATDLVEYLSNKQQEQAILAGMLTFSMSPSQTLWVESGITTLVATGEEEDEGWKKIKRVKVRFELFNRLDDTVSTLVGRVNNTPDGRSTLIQACNHICNTMVAEGKLHTGAYVDLDPENPPEGDSAWFAVYADDVDALEKLYYNFKFRFTVED